MAGYFFQKEMTEQLQNDDEVIVVELALTAFVLRIIQCVILSAILCRFLEILYVRYVDVCFIGYFHFIFSSLLCLKLFKSICKSSADLFDFFRFIYIVLTFILLLNLVIVRKLRIWVWIRVVYGIFNKIDLLLDISDLVHVLDAP